MRERVGYNDIDRMKEEDCAKIIQYVVISGGAKKNRSWLIYGRCDKLRCFVATRFAVRSTVTPPQGGSAQPSLPLPL